jgi:NADH-quinone oxidoreductase subunit L
MLFGTFFSDAIKVLPEHHTLAMFSREFVDVWSFGAHAIHSLPFWFMVAGILLASYIYLIKPQLAQSFAQRFAWFKSLLDHKYYFDDFNQKVLVNLSLMIGSAFWKAGDQMLIDGVAVNGSARSVGFIAKVMRKVQSGYLYHYALMMLVGLLFLFLWLYWPMK